jgi:hypothetical protein
MRVTVATDISTRYKLARINEKLSKIERQMDYLEAALKTVSGGGDAAAAEGQ